MRKAWKPTGKAFTNVGYKWKPTGRFFTIVGNSCPLTRFTPKKIVHLKETTPKSVETPKLEIKVYSGRPKQIKSAGSSKKTKIVESKMLTTQNPLICGDLMLQMYYLLLLLSMTGYPGCSLKRPSCKDHGYGDYQQGNVIISMVYYVEGLRHNLFSVGQFCDVDLEFTFRRSTCFIRNLEGVDLLSGSRDTNLYTISLDDMLKTSPICLLSKASKTKSWLWHRCLSHLNFGTLNKLAKYGLARGILKLKFHKDHLCSACALGKSKKSSHQPKAEDTNQEKLYLLHMDLCGPMRVERINGKKLFVIFMKVSAFHIKLLLLALLNRTALSKDEIELLWKLPALSDARQEAGFIVHSCFGLLCYPTNDIEDLGKLNAKDDIGLVLQVMTLATSSSGLVPNIIPQLPFLVAVTPRAVEIADSPVSTSIDQDEPSSSIPSTQDLEHSPIISQGVEESPNTPLFYDDPLHEFLHEDSTFQGSSSDSLDLTPIYIPINRNIQQGSKSARSMRPKAV
ncbi:integrase, catalytic region, zinc finger, CCHC-type containing protein, partial [Tanacetum coccineum]